MGIRIFDSITTGAVIMVLDGDISRVIVVLLEFYDDSFVW